MLEGKDITLDKLFIQALRRIEWGNDVSLLIILLAWLHVW